MPAAIGSLVGLGDPVMDTLAHVSHEYLASVTSEPGGCLPVSPEEMATLQASASQQSPLKRIPGGSAANVMKGLANISHGSLTCKFVGMVGKAACGDDYRNRLAAQGVVPVLLQSDSGAPSASAMCLVTPDGQRTMRTCLGASLELQSAAQVPNSWLDGISLLHCEGYCLYRPGLTREMTSAAKAKGALVSMDLASFELVRNCKDSLTTLLSEGCLDLLFANEEEAVTLSEELSLAPHDAPREDKVSAAQDYLLKYVKVSIVSLGPRGCTARSQEGQQGASGAAKVKVVDTIGAGDCFTAGFLYAYLHGANLQQCAAAGCAAGAKAVQAEGAELTPESWQWLQDEITRILAEDKVLVGANGVNGTH